MHAALARGDSRLDIVAVARWRVVVVVAAAVVGRGGVADALRPSAAVHVVDLHFKGKKQRKKC